MPVTLQSLDVTVFVVARHVLTETVRVRADTCCFAIGGIQHPVQSVVGELVAADGAFIPGLPRHAADVTVVAGGTHTRIVVQVLGEARTCDARQPAAEVIGIRQLVRRRAVQGLGTQTAETIVRIVCQSYFGSSQSMLHLAYTVCMVIAIGIDFRTCGLAACGMAMRHRGGLSRKGIDRISHVITAQKIVLYDFSYTPLDVIVIAFVNFSTAAGYSHRASCQGAFTVARSVVRELARRETRTAQFCTCTT